MEKKLVIIDGSSLLFRAFYALPVTMRSPDGTPTNAVYGFLRMLLRLYQQLDPEYMAVAFDKDRYTFRTEMYEGYKSTRKPAPPELVPQFSLIRDVLSVMGVAVYELDGYEGDDILGSLAARYEKEMPVAVVTGDRDALQLVSDDTTVYLTKRGITEMDAITPSRLQEIYGLTPSQVIDIKALMGDASDHIPGVPGIGEKTAKKLLSSYGTLNGIYDHVEELKGAQKKKLIDGKDSAYLSYQLATIRRDVPLKETLADMKQPIHADEMRELLGRLGINLVSQFAALPRFKKLADDKREETRECMPDIQAWPAGIDITGKTAALHVMLSGTEPFYRASSAVILTDGAVYAVEKDHFSAAAEALSKAGTVIVQDSKSITESDFPTKGIPFFDVTLAAYLLDSSRVTYPLSYLASAFDVPAVYPEKMDTEVEQGACVTAFLRKVYEPMHRKLSDTGALSLYETIEQPLVEVLASMEQAGIATDQMRWQRVREEMGSREQALVQSIYEDAGEVFNINSPKQLGYILFEKLGLPAGKKTKTGYSTAADVLEGLAEKYPFVETILEYRTLSKLISTYLDALPKLIRKETGRIHTSFNQMVTATGRLSSSDPNLQNIPTRTEEGRKIRSLFIPGKGYDCFISSDYSQVELRVLAHMSGDEGLIQAFLNKEDIHRRTAAEVLGIPFEEVTPEQRSHAKAVNFGIIYGISDFGLARQLRIERRAAADYIAAYFARYPRIHVFMNEMVESARKTGRASTLFGRYRELPDISSKNFTRRSFAERTAMNTPIQGTAADIMKLAMISVWRRMQEERLASRILLQVHDELVVEAVNKEKETVSAILKQCMESAASLRVPLVADIHDGSNWADAK